MRAAVTILAGLLLLLTAAAAACQDGDGGGRTGVPEVDAVVQAVLSSDQEALGGLVGYSLVPCTTEPGIGSELCRPGEPDGTLVDALLAADCEGHFIRPDGIDEALRYFLEGRPELYGVYQVPPATPGTVAVVGPDYVAVFSVEGPERGQAFGRGLGIGAGEVVFINFGCGQSPEELGERLEEEGWSTPVATPGASPVS